MNKQPHFTAPLSIRTRGEALKRQSYRSKGCALCITVIPASYRPLSPFYWVPGIQVLPKKGLSMGRAYLQNTSELRKEVERNQRTSMPSSIGMSYPQVPAGVVFVTRRRPHVDNPRERVMYYHLTGRIDSYGFLSVDLKLPLCY